MKKSIFLLLYLTLFLSSYAQSSLESTKLFSSGKFKDTVKQAKLEIEKSPQSLDSYVNLVWSLIENKQFLEARYWAFEGRKLSIYDHRLIESLGEIHYFLGSNNEALNYFQEYVSLVVTGQKISKVYYFMGEIYIRQGRFQHADISLSLAVRYENLNDVWWARLGYAREMSKNYTQAGIAYETALKLNTENADAQYGRTRITGILN
ncbi:MAG: tetratricopeptide repeat protein [Treponemataceae bacterium]